MAKEKAEKVSKKILYTSNADLNNILTIPSPHLSPEQLKGLNGKDGAD